MHDTTEENKKMLEGLFDNNVEIEYIRYEVKLTKHFYYRDLLKCSYKKITPHLIICDNDSHPFNTYLIHFAKKYKLKVLNYQNGNIEGKMVLFKKIIIGGEAVRLATKLKLPFMFSKLLILCKRLAMHYWYYFIAPLIVVYKPFLGKSSAYYLRGQPGQRNSDKVIVWGERELKLFIHEGVLKEKIIILRHPMLWDINSNIINKFYPNFTFEKNQVLILLPSNDSDFLIDKNSFKIINKEKIYNSWFDIIIHVRLKFPDYNIILKPHPATTDRENFYIWLKNRINELDNISFVDKKINSINYIIASKIIISTTTTALFSPSMYFRKKVFISFNLNNALLGNLYHHNNYVKYYCDFEKFLKDDFENENHKFDDKFSSVKFIELIESMIHEK